MQVESNNSPWFNPTQGKEVHFLNYCRFSPTLLTISTSNYLGMLYQTCLTMSFNCSTSAISTCQDIENIHTHYHSLNSSRKVLKISLTSYNLLHHIDAYSN